MGYTPLPLIAKQLPSPSRPSTEPLPGSRRRFFNQQMEEEGRPRTATPFTEEERVKTPALGYNGWYAGKKAGKLGTINLHTGRISEADNEYLMITQSINSPKSNLPYLEAVPIGYSEQEKQVYQQYSTVSLYHTHFNTRCHTYPSSKTQIYHKHPTLYEMRMAEKNEILAPRFPGGIVGSTKKKRMSPPTSPTSVTMAINSPGGNSPFSQSINDYDKSMTSFFPPGKSTVESDVSRVNAVIGVFLQHLQCKLPSKFNRQRHAYQIFEGQYAVVINTPFIRISP